MADALYIDGRLYSSARNIDVDDDLTVGDDATVSDDLTVVGDITLSSGGTITTTSNGDITLLPNGTGITVVGDAGSTSHSLNTNDDLFVSGDGEYDGKLYLDDGFQSSGTGRFQDNANLMFGSSNDCSIDYSTANTNHALVVGLSTDSESMIVCQAGDAGTNWAHADQTNPTIYVHSADATDTTKWISAAHNETDAEILTGKGGVLLSAPDSAPTCSGNGQVAIYLDESGHNLKVVAKYSDGTNKTATIAFD